MIDIATIENLAFGRFGTFDVACPLCGPERRKPLNRRRKVLRVWRLERGFATYHCARCGEGGYVRDDYAKPQIARAEFERRLAAARAEAAKRERNSAAERLAKALWLWKGRTPITDSIAEKYLREARGYRGALSATLGYLAPRGEHGPALIAAFGMAYEPEPGLLEIADAQARGVHITRLAADGSGKAGTERDKIMLGSSMGYPIVLAPPNDLLGLAIAEGIEDALSVHQSTGLGAWAAGSASRLPALADTVPSYIEAVTIAADPDNAGQRGARLLRERLLVRGIKEVNIVRAGNARVAA
jgi:Toprim domain